jgi:ubiquinone/menaquinone biosynthesis C-methylase UbiE
MTWIWIGAGALLVAGILYWQLILSEGSYLGPRVVAWLYDRAARRYDRIARYAPAFEDATIGHPLAQRLGADTDILLLDVATGTGRLPASLLRQNDFAGHIVGLDLSRGMLEKARGNLARHRSRISLVRHDATTLPFPDATFDAVTCLETLEFLPDQLSTIGEMVRVLKPGGLLLITLRVGKQARAFPGKRISRSQIFDILEPYPFDEIILTAWEVNYDQVWCTLAPEAAGPLPVERHP